jgi:hypothetical protein
VIQTHNYFQVTLPPQPINGVRRCQIQTMCAGLPSRSASFAGLPPSRRWPIARLRWSFSSPPLARACSSSPLPLARICPSSLPSVLSSSLSWSGGSYPAPPPPSPLNCATPTPLPAPSCQAPGPWWRPRLPLAQFLDHPLEMIVFRHWFLVWFGTVCDLYGEIGHSFWVSWLEIA